MEKEKMQEIAMKIKAERGTLYLVGGAVRDEIMGKEKADEDYCVVGLSQKAFEKAGFVFHSEHPDGDAWYYRYHSAV